MLIHGDEARVVRGFADLQGCVAIHNEVDALEYLRFFSSYETVYLFEQKDLEVYRAGGEKCFAVCLPPDRWKALNLSDPIVKRVSDDFEVTRYVISRLPGTAEISLFRATQKVTSDGNVTDLNREPVPIGPDDLLRLFFPRFL